MNCEFIVDRIIRVCTVSQGRDTCALIVYVCDITDTYVGRSSFARKFARNIRDFHTRFRVSLPMRNFVICAIYDFRCNEMKHRYLPFAGSILENVCT